MSDLLWIALPLFAALGSGALAFIVAQARMEATLSREREELVQARERLTQQHSAVEDRVRAAAADSRRKAFDEFLADVRIEERHHLREVDTLSERRKCLVLQERVCFRNIPLSQWIERELPYLNDVTVQKPQPPAPVILSAAPRRRLLR